MIDKYLQKLEFNIIKDKLSEMCFTFVGKNIANNLEPSSNPTKVETLLSETLEACLLIQSSGTFPIYELDDLSVPIKQLESSNTLSIKSLLDMANILKVARSLTAFYKNSKIEFKFLCSYFEDLYTNQNIEDKIFSSIISETEIADNASNALKSIRKNKKALELDIKNKLNSFIHSNTYSKYLMDSVITIRNNRYVVPVKVEYQKSIKGFIHDTSSSGSTVYIEPMAVFEMNNSINNLLIEESKEIERILSELSKLLFPISGFLKQNINLIGKLDFISAKAKYSIANDCIKPNIDTYVDFIAARHPLIPKDKVVPISLSLGKDDFTTLVITGPNTGGKTVTLKTVGLLCAMAQAGLHIPASEGSSIKIFDNIFADIGDEQSIEASLSTFSSHMTNIVQILKNYTENSLILVDELGSGTDPIEGANLAISLLETFNKNKAFTIATTHYHEIKTYCISHPGFENASCEFDIKTLKPTYKLLIGIPGKSNAFAICSHLGIPDEIISRASHLISKPDTDIETLMKEIYDDKIESEKYKNEIEKNLNQVELLRKSLEHEVSDKLANQEKKIEEAKKEARQILLDAKDEANKIISKLSKLDSKDIDKANNLRNELNSSLKKYNSNGPDLSVLLKINEKKYDMSSLANSSKASSVHIKNNAALSVSTEINLIGETVASAVEILDKYLDNCSMAHLNEVRVVHGKGSGKLRQGIHQYLKKSKYVKSFNIAGYGEGDYGVTIVHLK